MTLPSLLPLMISRRPLNHSIAKSFRFLCRQDLPPLPASQQPFTSRRYPHHQHYSTTARYSFPSKGSFPVSNNHNNNSNAGLESVIGQGLASLTQTAKDVQSKTKKVKSIESPTTTTTTSTLSGPTTLASHKQLAESQRLLDVTTECLDALCDKNPNHPLAMRGEPIAILDVQVNINAKQAKVYWSLPYGILMDDRLTRTTYQKLVARMETHLLQGGGASLLQKMVHTRLRFYYPPKLKFIPAPPRMVAEAVGDFPSLEQLQEEEEETSTTEDS